jgi:acyl carrier protein
MPAGRTGWKPVFQKLLSSQEIAATLARMSEPTETTLDRLTRITAEQLGVEPHLIRPESLLDEDLGADSLDCVELGMAIEEEFSVTIEEEEMEKIRTIGEAVKLIDEKLA